MLDFNLPLSLEYISWQARRKAILPFCGSSWRFHSLPRNMGIITTSLQGKKRIFEGVPIGISMWQQQGCHNMWIKPLNWKGLIKITVPWPLQCRHEIMFLLPALKSIRRVLFTFFKHEANGRINPIAALCSFPVWTGVINQSDRIEAGTSIMIHLLREAGCEMLMGGIPALWRICHNWGRADSEKLAHAGCDSVHRDSLLE